MAYFNNLDIEIRNQEREDRERAIKELKDKTKKEEREEEKAAFKFMYSAPDIPSVCRGCPAYNESECILGYKTRDCEEQI